MKQIERLSKLRHKIIRDIEDFFLNKDYTAVETPLLSKHLIPESSIEFFKTEQMNPWGKNEELYLVPSPEIWMKKLLGQGMNNIFQVSKCFRNSEQSGRIHNHEFTMLEWYGSPMDYNENLLLTNDFLAFLSDKDYCKNSQLLQSEPTVYSLDKAFKKWAGFSLKDNYSQEALFSQAIQLGLKVNKTDSQEQLFNHILITFIEPNLPKDRPCYLIDYPQFIPTLSMNVPNSPWTQRWELYINGIELANCYTELTNSQSILQYMQEETKVEKMVSHRIDLDFQDCFQGRTTTYSGTALGIDRLIMTLLGIDNIEGVLLFPDLC